MAQRVLLHVGAPKTGTSFVQDLLFRHRDELAGLGILYPADRFDAHFLAALDLMQLTWGGLEHQATGRWQRLADEVRAWDGTAIISHEILGKASRRQAEQAISSLGDGEVHVVLSARDLVRQIPAEWQENVKHRRTKSYADFLADLRDPSRPDPVSQWFWGVQEVPDVLGRWAASLPADRVHVVTVPPSGSDPGELWRRFARVFALDARAIAPSAERANTSLGVAEAALVRRLNVAVNPVLGNERYREFVRELLVHRTLAPERRSAKLSLPPDAWEWAAGISRDWAEQLAGRGYDVVGDLADLVPSGPPLPWVDPDHPDEGEVAEAGVRALSAAVQETARLREVEIELHGVIGDLEAELAKLRRSPVQRLKRRLVRTAQGSAAGRLALRGYRRLRGSSSRPA
ncbi:MAG TPA: hypothetical protein VFL69_07285 [Marmoricola sp.]|nr:hypothetical protein [Marmoricola sp.]